MENNYNAVDCHLHDKGKALKMKIHHCLISFIWKSVLTVLGTQILSWQIVSSKTLTKPLVLKNGRPAGKGSITVRQ